ncbi:hypothetical protein CSUI_005222 [Cystoisospora suis]|uniref:Uncharacterized protein n=1 Tax=Cystoisospora suis TaxID=483139 RepID=A0A2C6KYB7_9APIC|nr:hypothetical protein CSUI_005222 [Cystoisospora suis]
MSGRWTSGEEQPIVATRHFSHQSKPAGFLKISLERRRFDILWLVAWCVCCLRCRNIGE